MVVTVIDTNAQSQRMVVTLKNICRDYPAGGGILRELLQNADDAGATKVRFVLDERTHPTSPLIHEHLAQFQGPALLAYNNAQFTDKDFNNLKNTGDSYKLDDGATTGRFGRGFNSVYNWTDSPSIVSRNRLLILDPHEWWSRGMGLSPVFDFVGDAADSAMQNQMQAYSSILTDLDKPLEGTIIRVPLRTRKQDPKSEIIDCELPDCEVNATVVKKVFEMFATEFGNCGMLFMRNIEQIEVQTTSGMDVKIALRNLNVVRTARANIKAALQSAFQNGATVFDQSFAIRFSHTSNNTNSIVDFAVHHHIHAVPNDQKLGEWARKQKITSWVAVAAPLQVSPIFQGSLFTVVPLPIENAQPVHIHALFSISPDRARLNLEDANITDKKPAQWNRFLFEHSIPSAWSSLLSFVATAHPAFSTFNWWPRSSQDSRDPLRKVASTVVEYIARQNLCVFPSVAGYRTASQALLVTGKESAGLVDALNDAHIPMVRATAQIRDGISHLFVDRMITPASVSLELHNNLDHVSTWSDATKKKILDYLITAPKKVDYEALEIFPFEDGSYRAVNASPVFVHRDDGEASFFALQKSRNIDLKKVFAGTLHVLHTICSAATTVPVIRYRRVADFKEYCHAYLFVGLSPEVDFIPTAAVDGRMMAKAWAWLNTQLSTLLDPEIASLWLLPLSNGTYRKIQPLDASCRAMIVKKGELGNLLRALDRSGSSRAPSLVDLEMVKLKDNNKLLTEHGVLMPLSLLYSENPIHIAEWCRDNSELVAKLSDNDKEIGLRHLAKTLTNDLKAPARSRILAAVQPLRIFKKLEWTSSSDELTISHSWTSLDACSTTIAILDEIDAFLEVGDCQTITTELDSPAQTLINVLNCAERYTGIDYVAKFVIPRFGASISTFPVKYKVAGMVFSKYTSLPLLQQKQLRHLDIVPLMSVDGSYAEAFGSPSVLVNPDAPAMTQLFFGDETICPQQTFHNQHGAALKFCGLNETMNDELVERRVEAYASVGRAVEDVQMRVHTLLESTYHSKSGTVTKFQSSAWIPVLKYGFLQRLTAKQCRGRQHKLLVGFVLPIVDVHVSNTWQKLLGWDKPVADEVLLDQLKESVVQEDLTVIHAVLNSIKNTAALKSVAFVLTKSGRFARPDNVFKTGAEGLSPYIDNVETMFWNAHENLLQNIGVRNSPAFDDLMQVQASLQSMCPLTSDDNLAVAIELANRCALCDRESQLQVRLLSASGDLLPAQSLVYANVETLAGDNHIFTHPRLTQAVAFKLGAELLGDLRRKKLLEIDDIDDDDEFDQKEQISTRIRDTLDRYPVEATFREYLANADDAGATKVSWLLDERHHPCTALLTPDIDDVQGPALLVHNDSVFTESDYMGFKNVGEGSKRQNAAAIGQFGRGSQTMYHFTDTPMILSGAYLIILDPQQQVLLHNQRKLQRKPGVKILLKNLREACPGHLEAFDGLFGYSAQLSYFPGTIFRFPLRTTSTNSHLRDSAQYLDVSKTRHHLSSYFHEARISLLFLKNVKSIEYTIHGETEPHWSIMQQSSRNIDGVSGTAIGKKTVYTISFDSPVGRIDGEDSWWSVITSVQPLSEEPSRSRVLKQMECGIAALTSSIPTGATTRFDFAKCQMLNPKIFSSLPLPLDSKLPVHVHATFSLSGDRGSLVISEHGADTRASWNSHLLSEVLPELYLILLEALAMNLPEEVSRFWPRAMSFAGSCTHQLFNSLKAKLPLCERRLYLQAQKSDEVGQSAPRVLNFKESVFDIDTKLNLDSVAQMLLSLDVPLVRNLPYAISDFLSKDARAARITEISLRKLFTSGKSKMILQETLSNQPVVFSDLLKLVLLTSTEPESLNFCHFIKLEDGELGTLKVRPTKMASADYYVGTVEELRLFDFAHGVLVSRSSWEPFSKIKSEDFFTVDKLKLIHLPALFQLRSSSARPFDKTFLERFWIYWNSHINTQQEAKQILHDLPVCVVDCDGRKETASLHDLQRRATIVNPIEQGQRMLCGRFSGLRKLDPAYVSADVLAAETSLSQTAAFYRLLKALEQLCPQGQTFGQYVSSRLKDDDIRTLKGLIMSHTLSANSIAGQSVGQTEFNTYKSLLAQLPVWESCDFVSSNRLLSASEALIISEDNTNDLLVPWMKDYGLFVPHVADVPKTLGCLGTQRITVFDVVRSRIFPLPALSASSPNWSFYLGLVGYLYTTWRHNNGIGSLYKQQSLAVDQELSYRGLDLLYDHDDPLFKAAFRHENQTRFLHDSLKQYRRMWLALGMQRNTNSIMSPVAYTKCLQILSQRLLSPSRSTDTHLPGDCNVVLDPLISQGFRMQSFGDSDWNNISAIPLFEVMTNVNSQPLYRRQSMLTLATGQPLLNLRDVISNEYVSACWSQTPFPGISPTNDVLAHFRSGKPSVLIVWRHLMHLKEMTQYLKANEVQDFLYDLTATYKFLQENNCDDISHQAREDNLWLNLATFDGNAVILADVRNEWVSAKNLVLSSSCDAGDKKAVKAGLMRFESLLRTMGSTSVMYPTVERPTAHVSHSIGDSLRVLRDQGKLLDVHYHSQGQTVKAHRVVLAAISDMCVRQFSRPWVDNVERDAEGALQFRFTNEDDDAFLSHFTLKTIVDYAYDSQINWSDMLVKPDDDLDAKQERLDKLIDLLHGADYMLIDALKSQVEGKILDAGKELITIANVRETLKSAKSFNAIAVESYCGKFIECNLDVLDDDTEEEQ